MRGHRRKKKKVELCAKKESFSLPAESRFMFAILFCVFLFFSSLSLYLGALLGYRLTVMILQYTHNQCRPW
jgi:hypothetical protein